MPSGNLVIDKYSDIFVESPQVDLYSPAIVMSSDGRTIIFRVYFVDGKELLNHERVTIIYGYTLLKGPMKTENFISQLRWHNTFSVPVSQISYKFLYDTSLFNNASIVSSSSSTNGEFSRWVQSMSGVDFNVLEFNGTNITSGSSFVGAFNATNLKYSTCSFQSQQQPSDIVFFFSVIIPLLIGFLFIVLLSFLILVIQRHCRKRVQVTTDDNDTTTSTQQQQQYRTGTNATAASSPNTNRPSGSGMAPSTTTTNSKEQSKQQSSAMYYVENTFNNVENNDGFTGVVVSHMNNAQTSQLNNGGDGNSAPIEEIVQYTPGLINYEHHVDLHGDQQV